MNNAYYRSDREREYQELRGLEVPDCIRTASLREDWEPRAEDAEIVSYDARLNAPKAVNLWPLTWGLVGLIVLAVVIRWVALYGGI